MIAYFDIHWTGLKCAWKTRKIKRRLMMKLRKRGKTPIAYLTLLLANESFVDASVTSASKRVVL